jgi:hypothetical protein
VSQNTHNSSYIWSRSLNGTRFLIIVSAIIATLMIDIYIASTFKRQ